MNNENLLTRFVMLLVLPLVCQAFLVPHGAQQPIRRLVTSESSADEPDLFDYFDPLRSPHDYPDGIAPDSKPKKDEEEIQKQASKEPLGLDIFASEFPSAFIGSADSSIAEEQEDDTTNKFATTSKEDEAKLDLFDVFDPTLSPHAYPNGIPSTTKSESAKMVGILLMDHGSRNEASNQRLHDLARLYQNSLSDEGPNKVVVKAAHMEIAEPSIPEVLASLVELGVDEIVCHPYFLSPGRHVKEDIPEIVDGAIEKLGIEIPITTTPQLGSNTEMMIAAINSLVEESSASLDQNRKMGL